MDLVRLDENNEITIPTSVYEQIGVKIGDLIAMSVEDGHIVIRSLTAAAAAQQAKEEIAEAAAKNAKQPRSVPGAQVSLAEFNEFVRAARRLGLSGKAE